MLELTSPGKQSRIFCHKFTSLTTFHLNKSCLMFFCLRSHTCPLSVVENHLCSGKKVDLKVNYILFRTCLLSAPCMCFLHSLLFVLQSLYRQQMQSSIFRLKDILCSFCSCRDFFLEGSFSLAILE